MIRLLKLTAPHGHGRAGKAAAVAVCALCTAPAAVALPTGSSKSNGVGQAEAQSTQVWLAVRAQAAQQFVTASSTPGSKGFRHFLSPAEYTRRFGASAAEVKAVEAFLTQQHFKQVTVSAGNDYVSGIAPAADHSELKIPVSLSHDVVGVTGRNDAAVKSNLVAASLGPVGKPADAGSSASGPGASSYPCGRYWGEKTQKIMPAFKGVDAASLPMCGYSANEIRRAYGLTPSDRGTGETIALIQEGGPQDMPKTLARFATANGLHAPTPGQYREVPVNGGTTSRSCQNTAGGEAELDSQAAFAMAPGAKQLVFDGDDCDTNDTGAQSLFDAMLTPLTVNGPRPSATIESISWNIPSGQAMLAVNHVIALRAAAEGVSVLVASGDQLTDFASAIDPNLTAVGGTSLGLGANGQRLFETGWTTAYGERAGTSGQWKSNGVLNGAGGGVDTQFPEPSYQRGVVPNSIAHSHGARAGRAVPDISLDADFTTGLSIYEADPRTGRLKATWEGGTSQSTPLFAGFVADAEHGHSGSFGLLNPLLYKLSGSKAITDVLPLPTSTPSVDRAFFKPGVVEFHGKFGTGYLVGVNAAKKGRATLHGYDTLTGVGTPNGSAFLNALRAGS
jgi:subtilase family serine protease